MTDPDPAQKPTYSSPRILRVRYAYCDECGTSDKVIQPSDKAWNPGLRPICRVCKRPMNVGSSPLRRRK